MRSERPVLSAKSVTPPYASAVAAAPLNAPTLRIVTYRHNKERNDLNALAQARRPKAGELGVDALPLSRVRDLGSADQAGWHVAPRELGYSPSAAIAAARRARCSRLVRTGSVGGAIRARVAGMQRRALENELAAGEVGPERRPEGSPADVRVPALVLVGDLDVPDMLDVADAYVREIPGARRVVMHGVAHIPSLERPNEFDRLVLDFLARA